MFGPSLVVVGLTCQEVGASIAVKLFPAVGPVGMVALRLVFSAILLLLIARPNWGAYSARGWRIAVLFGLVLGAMNVFFYLALDRLPLGTAVTIEVLGPLALSVVTGRRWINLVWAVLAAGGVVLLGGGATDLDPVGVVFALLAAAMWAAYILLSKATGDYFPGLSGLAIATTVGALLTAPIAAVQVGVGLLSPYILLAGLGIAVLSSTIPYALELTALRHTSAATFAILLALAPAIAAGAGFLILSQLLSTLELLGIAAVIIASIGAIRTPSHADRGSQAHRIGERTS